MDMQKIAMNNSEIDTWGVDILITIDELLFLTHTGMRWPCMRHSGRLFLRRCRNPESKWRKRRFLSSTGGCLRRYLLLRFERQWSARIHFWRLHSECHTGRNQHGLMLLRNLTPTAGHTMWWSGLWKKSMKSCFHGLSRRLSLRRAKSKMRIQGFWWMYVISKVREMCVKCPR